MKRILSFVLAFIAVFSLVSVTVDRSEAADIMPYYNNTNSASVTLTINSSGKATVACICKGISGVTTSIKAETKLERKWGIFWLDVDGGEWTDTTKERFLSVAHYLQLEKTGTYRATTKYTVSGSGGSNDVIEISSTYDYD